METRRLLFFPMHDAKGTRYACRKKSTCRGRSVSVWVFSGVQGHQRITNLGFVCGLCLQVLVRAATAPLTSQQRGLLHTAIRRGRFGQQQQDTYSIGGDAYSDEQQLSKHELQLRSDMLQLQQLVVNGPADTNTQWHEQLQQHEQQEHVPQVQHQAAEQGNKRASCLHSISNGISCCRSQPGAVACRTLGNSGSSNDEKRQPSSSTSSSRVMAAVVSIRMLPHL
ncbi:hypothetical protein COO60DRAFT_1211712 [Scenedesmus sp. NREL 46B-D3]|nr:hypothetical protein COO60DRAFT_1211712 [Scenedesmus sp. NREL 46B-D3]